MRQRPPPVTRVFARCRRYGRVSGIAVLALLVSATVPMTSVAGELGGRAGTGVEGPAYSMAGGYWRPWSAHLVGREEGWHLTGYAELAAGRVGYREDALRMASIGVGAWVGRGGGSWLAGFGTAPSYISEHRLGGQEFGGGMQFTSHLAIRWQVTRVLSLAYRIQHTSNAGIYSENDGLDLQVLELGLAY